MCGNWNLSDLVASADAGSDAFTTAFNSNIGDVYRFGLKDVQEALDMVNIDYLVALHKTLCSGVQDAMPQFKGRRPINRQVKHTLIPDIYQLGLSLCNGTPSRDLDKVFSATHSAPSSPPSGADELQRLILAVADLTTRVGNLEETVNNLRSENSILRDSRDAQGNPNDLPPSHDPALPDPTEELAAASNSAEVTPSNGVAEEPSGQSSLQNSAPQRRVSPRAPNPAPRRVQPNNMRNGAESNPQPTSDGVAMYLGAIDAKHSASDIKDLVQAAGLPAPLSSRVLSTKNGWRSFVVTMPNQGSANRLARLTSSGTWDPEIKIRPFRAARPQTTQAAIRRPRNTTPWQQHSAPQHDSRPRPPPRSNFPNPAGRNSQPPSDSYSEGRYGEWVWRGNPQRYRDHYQQEEYYDDFF